MSTRSDAFLASPRHAIGLVDLGSSKVSCCVVRLDAEGLPLILGRGSAQHSALAAGAIVDMGAAQEAIAAAVQQAESEAGERINEVTVAVGLKPVCEVVHQQIDIGGQEVGERHLEKVARAIVESLSDEDDANRLIHLLPRGYLIDGVYEISNPRGMVGQELTVGASAVWVQACALRNIELCFERCQLRVSRFVLSALASGMGLLEEDERDLGAAVVDFGAGTTSLALFWKGVPLWLGQVPAAGGLITSDLAHAFMTSRQEAERIKRDHATLVSVSADEDDSIGLPEATSDGQQTRQISRSMLSRVVRARVDEILQPLGEELLLQKQHGVSAHRVVVTGGSALLSGICEYANRIFGCPVRVRLAPQVQLPNEADGAVLLGLANIVSMPGFDLLDFVRARTRRQGLLTRFRAWLFQD